MVSSQQNTVASNHRLVEVLCQAVKPSFNKTQDECHIEMAPGSHAQEVDIKHITIISELRARVGRPPRGWEWGRGGDGGHRDGPGLSVTCSGDGGTASPLSLPCL